MQDSTPEFDNAMAQPSVVWAKPLLRAGWNGEDPRNPNPFSQMFYRDDFNRTSASRWLAAATNAGTLEQWSWDHLLDTTHLATQYTVAPGSARHAVNARNSTWESWVSKVDGAATRFTHDTFDAGISSWVGEAGTTVAHETTIRHDGGGSLRATETMGAGFSELRFNDAAALRDLSFYGETLTAWVLVPSGAPGTGWQARMEVQDPGFTWIPGPNFTITPGVWTQVSMTPSASLLQSCRSIGFAIGASGVNQSQSVYVDTVDQSLSTDGASEFFGDVDLTVFTTVSGTATGSGAGFAEELRPGIVHGSGSWEFGFDYALEMELNIRPDNSTNITLHSTFFDGIDTVFVDTLVDEAPTGITHSAGKRYGMRYQRAGSFIRLKVWDAASTQPDEWTVEVVNDGPYFVGRIGLRSIVGINNTNALPYTFNYDTFSLTDLGVLDNLTDQVAEQITVSHSLDDGLPDAVSSSVGSDPVGSVAIGLTGTTVDGEQFDPRQYFSPFNTSSPVHGFDRDVAPIELDMGALTTNGEEYVRLFTGQMVNIVVSGRSATLQAISRTRLMLAKAVKAPLIDGKGMGANASAIISWILYDCGIQICPWPNPGTRWWAPFHGSSVSFIPNQPGSAADYDSRYFTQAGIFTHERPPFRQGKFLGASDTKFDKYVGHDIFNWGLDLAPGEDLLSQAGNEGRLEFWIYGGDWGPLGFERLAYMRIDQSGSGVVGYILPMVDENHELLFWMDAALSGGSGDKLYYSGLVVPEDNQWHFCGFYWNVADNRLIATLDGRERTITPSPTLNASLLPLNDNISNGGPDIIAKHPISDVMLTTGSDYADPDNNPWNSYLSFTQGALVVSEDWEDTTYNVTWSGTWARDNTQAQAGTWSVKSAAIGHNLISDLVMTVPTGAEEITFWHRVSTEEDFDFFYLLFSLDYDDFTRVVANGLGTSMGGYPWTVAGGANSDYAVNGSAATMQMTALNSTRNAYLNTFVMKDVEVSGTVTVPVLPTGSNSMRPGLVLRQISATTFLGCDLLINAGTGNVQLRIYQMVNGNFSTLNTTATLFTHVAGDQYGIVLRAEGEVVSAKVWKTTGNQPTPWNLTAITTLLGEGSPGIQSVLDTGITNALPVTFTWDSWKIRPLYAQFFKSGVLNAWYPATLQIPSNVKQITFRYSKDTATIGGSDAVWMDSLEFREAPAIVDTFVPDAVVRFVDLELEAVTDKEAREAWAYLSDIAQSSLVAMRTDEIDRLNMLTPGWFVEPDQQLPAYTIDTQMNAQDPDITIDPTKIRNSIQVNYKETRVDTSWQYVYQSTTAISVPKGSKVTVELVFDRPATEIDETMTTEPDTTPLITSPTSRVFANTAEDGSGTYLNDTQFIATILAWDASSATVQLWNKTNATAYVANGISESYPYISIAGYGVTETDASATVSESQPRGERTLTVTPPIMHTKENARRFAASILALTRQSRPEIVATVMGDPRRQPADLTSLADAEGTQISGSWRVVEIEHQRNGAQYVQKMSLRKAQTLALWDDESAGWDEGVWG